MAHRAATNRRMTASTIVSVATKLPSVVITVYQVKAERAEMQKIMLGALARAICANDPENPCVQRLAADISARLWIGEPRPKKRQNPLRRVIAKAQKWLRKPDPEVIDALRWREEMKAWLAPEMTQHDLQDTLQRAACVDGPRSVAALVDSFPNCFIAELNAVATPLRLRLRDRVKQADEERHRWVVSEVAKRYGIAAAAAALAATGIGEVAHLLDLNDLQDAIPVLFGGYFSALTVKRGQDAFRRAKLRRATCDWISRCRAALDGSAEDRGRLLVELRERLIRRAERSGDDRLRGAFEDVEDGLIGYEYRQFDRAEIATGLERLEELAGCGTPERET
jgi:hypothetical protein